MTLQTKTLQRYRQIFKEETLRETSARTGIQITRVFRLFNGKTMKVSELEAFQKAIEDKLSSSPNYLKMNKLLEQATGNLDNQELGKISDYIERRLKNKSYLGTFSSNFEKAIIA
ncbi:MAG: hypothetical protein AB7I27_05805 [Bacteriovoracaceae bacterium]